LITEEEYFLPNKTLNLIKRILRAAWGLVVALARVIASLVGLLADSAKAPDTNDPSDVAPSGGVLNYRTGKLDDGTDPVGWYEKD
jgi:hypothetical protein